MGNNWVGGVAPPGSEHDIRFNDQPGGQPAGPEEAVNVNMTRVVRSLWFDAGVWYNLGGSTLAIGQGAVSIPTVSDWGENVTPLVTVQGYLNGQSEVNLNNPVVFHDHTTSLKGLISNFSQGGLRFGGTVYLGSGTKYIGGSGATHFAGALSGSTALNVWRNHTTHLVLSGNNSGWSGALNVHPESLAFIKTNGALGTDINAVQYTGTLSFRAHGHGPALNYNNSNVKEIRVNGPGAVRQLDIAPVGAIHHDGGTNIFNGNILMDGHTSFGARGDRGGSLTLNGKIHHAYRWAYSFTKVGPGLIVLTNTQNAWGGPTTIKAGVLRITAPGVLPTTTPTPTRPLPIEGIADPAGRAPKKGGGSNKASTGTRIVFDGVVNNHLTGTEGGFLEFAGDGGGAFFGLAWNYTLGTAAGNVQWLGSGGFSTYHDTPSSMRIVQINSGATLQFGQQHFVPTDKELLLSSHYANSAIYLLNHIRAGGATIRVERGQTKDAYGIVGLTSGGPGTTFTKRGDGLLLVGVLDNTTPVANAIMRIEGGALGGPALGTGNIQLAGGVVMLYKGDLFTRNVGTGGNQIRWTDGSGGFAASKGDATVRLNNSSGVINWDSSHFLQSWGSLKFGHYAAGGTVIWDKELSLGGNQAGIYRRIMVERGHDLSRADVLFNRKITGTASAYLRIEGDGRMDTQAIIESDGILEIHGAELRLNKAGAIKGAGLIEINNGGTLTLDNSGTYNSEVGGYGDSDRLTDSSSVSINRGGSLRLWGPGSGTILETIRHLQLPGVEAGAATIELNNFSNTAHTQLSLRSIARATVENFTGNSILDKHARGTLDLRTNRTFIAGANNGQVSIRVTNWGELIYGNLPGGVTVPWHYSSHQINDHDPAQSIIPWATVNGLDWVHLTAKDTYLVALPEYYTSSTAYYWQPGHNVSVETNIQLYIDKVINSLRLKKANLNIRDSKLALDSGGLLSAGKNSITGAGILALSDNASRNDRPFYAHVYSGDLTISEKVAIDSVSKTYPGSGDFIKTGDGNLILKSAAKHRVNNLYIHEGTVSLRAGNLLYGSIVIGDYSGTSVLELPANSWNSLVGNSKGSVIWMKGPHYGPGPEYGGHASILRMGGNTKQSLNRLTVMEGRHTVIDFVGGEVGRANILWIDELEFDQNSRLYIRNWYQYEDYLLVGKDFNPKFIYNIIFEGYEDFPVLAIAYDENYWQVTPFYAPEPGTYGAILGALGLGLWGWKRSQKRGQWPTCRKRGAVAPPRKCDGAGVTGGGSHT